VPRLPSADRPTGLVLALAFAGAACWPSPHGAAGCRAEDRPRGLATAAWKLEAVELVDGRRLEGLVVDPADADDDIGFVQVVRSPGRPMYLVSWGSLPAERIRSIRRLQPADHTALIARVQAFRDRRDIRLRAETDVRLIRDGEDEPWRYAGGWFTLESTADPRLTSEAIVRLEQVFGALETLVPVGRSAADEVSQDAVDGAGRLQVRLCGSSAEYRLLQEGLGIRGKHPAFYVPSKRLLVAGSDMPAIIEQQGIAAENLAAAEQRYATLDGTLEDGVRRLAADLERQGIPGGKRAEIVQRARSRWEREKAEALTQIDSARRDNRLGMESARNEFYSWLVHEAWHAHADGRGPDRTPLPLWLDEGLAQVFETAPLEAGELRLDAPDPVRLAFLQELLRRPAPPTVADVLAAGQEQFLVGHAGSVDSSRKAYLMAWGLAFDLALLQPVLSPASLAALQRRTGEQGPDAVRQFEQLVGMTVGRFEAAWRRRMLALRPREPVVIPGEGNDRPRQDP